MSDLSPEDVGDLRRAEKQTPEDNPPRPRLLPGEAVLHTDPTIVADPTTQTVVIHDWQCNRRNALTYSVCTCKPLLLERKDKNDWKWRQSE